MGIPEEEERKGQKKLIEVIVVENFTKLITQIKPEIQEVHRTQSRINSKTFYRAISFSNCRKPKARRKSLKYSNSYLLYAKHNISILLTSCHLIHMETFFSRTLYLSPFTDYKTEGKGD